MSSSVDLDFPLVMLSLFTDFEKGASSSISSMLADGGDGKAFEYGSRELVSIVDGIVMSSEDLVDLVPSILVLLVGWSMSCVRNKTEKRKKQECGRYRKNDEYKRKTQKSAADKADDSILRWPVQ